MGSLGKMGKRRKNPGKQSLKAPSFDKYRQLRSWKDGEGKKLRSSRLRFLARLGNEELRKEIDRGI